MFQKTVGAIHHKKCKAATTMTFNPPHAFARGCVTKPSCIHCFCASIFGFGSPQSHPLPPSLVSLVFSVAIHFIAIRF